MTSETYELFSKKIENTLSKKESKILEIIFKEDPNLLDEFESFKEVWIQSTQIEPCPIEGKEEVWQTISNRIHTESQTIVPHKKLYIYKIAASIALLIALGGGSFVFFNNYYSTVSIATGDVYSPIEWELPDHTKVYLDHDSQLEYPKHFGWFKRKVTLEGQGYFIVTHMPSKPFEIKSKQSTTKVLGTTFNIRAYTKEPYTSVSLLNGKVAFSPHNNKNSIYIKPGQTVEYNREVNKVRTLSEIDKNITAWKERNLVFENDELSYVFDILSNFFNMDFIADDNTINNLHFTGTYNQPELNDLLKILSFSLDVDYKINGKTIVLSLKQ